MPTKLQIPVFLEYRFWSAGDVDICLKADDQQTSTMCCSRFSIFQDSSTEYPEDGSSTGTDQGSGGEINNSPKKGG